MLYAILAYHVEAEVISWTAEKDAAVMASAGQPLPLSWQRRLAKAISGIARLRCLRTGRPAMRLNLP
jgi:hypothetical protein